MRLIDADAINPMRCPQSIAEMREWLDNIPTAYDIDKVVGRLISHRKHIIDKNGDCIGEYRTIPIEKAIEIVKKGGAE